MTPRKTKPASSDPAEEAPKTRRCLRCRSDFTSAWAGERVCPRCKGTLAWRNGVPLRTTRTPGRR